MAEHQQFRQFEGGQIRDLIPQRPPMMMVDFFEAQSLEEGDTALTITEENIFCEGGLFREPGLIEHVAQSAAAYAGFNAFLQGLPTKIGFIGELKRFKIHSLAGAGTTIKTHFKILGSAEGVTLFSSQTFCGEALLCEGRMKIFIKA